MQHRDPATGRIVVNYVSLLLEKELMEWTAELEKRQLAYLKAKDDLLKAQDIINQLKLHK